MKLSLCLFGLYDEGEAPRYDLSLELVDLAEEFGFHAIWTPERHFDPFGGLFPAPAVLSAALAARTKRVALRAGSVVLPRRDPASVAEEWALVDNLSAGRVGVAVAAGYTPLDFWNAPERYSARNDLLFEYAETLQALWRGEPSHVHDACGQPAELRIYPRPVQRELPLWITCGGSNVDKFYRAGQFGANVLTALFVQDAEALRERIVAYRRGRKDADLPPESGQVTCLVHTFVGKSEDDVSATVRAPLARYLQSSVGVWAKGFSRLQEVPDERRPKLVEFAVERYIRHAALVGQPSTCRAFLATLADTGVDEVACLVDFGVAADEVVRGVRRLAELHDSLGATEVSQ